MKRAPQIAIPPCARPSDIDGYNIERVKGRAVGTQHVRVVHAPERPSPAAPRASSSDTGPWRIPRRIPHHPQDRPS